MLPFEVEIPFVSHLGFSLHKWADGESELHYHARPVRKLEAAGAVVICLPAPDSSRIDLPALMHDLGRREVNELHVEAGGILNGALLQAGLVDELVLYQAPMLLGQGQDAFGGMALAQLQNAPLLEMVESIAIGSDQRIIARLGGHYDF